MTQKIELSKKQKERIRHMIQFCEYEKLIDAQHEWFVKFERQFEEMGFLSEIQIEIMENIFKQAAEKA